MLVERLQNWSPLQRVQTSAQQAQGRETAGPKAGGVLVLRGGGDLPKPTPPPMRDFVNIPHGISRSSRGGMLAEPGLHMVGGRVAARQTTGKPAIGAGSGGRGGAFGSESGELGPIGSTADLQRRLSVADDASRPVLARDIQRTHGNAAVVALIETLGAVRVAGPTTVATANGYGVVQRGGDGRGRRTPRLRTS
jgi:hypothetical protein